MLSLLVLLLLHLLPYLTTSLPTRPIFPRAGAPIPKPIPSNCTLHLTSARHSATLFQATPAFVTANSLYTSITYPGENTFSEDQLVANCLATCYGYGTVGQCVSVLVASNVTVMEYGTEVTGTVCQLFGKRLAVGDLEAPEVDGTYTDARAVDIECPAT